MHENTALVLVSFLAAQEAVAVYCVPTLIALIRGLPNRGHIAVINMYLGWSIIGWVYALIQAIKPADAPAAESFSTSAAADRDDANSPTSGGRG